jgi:hypothetical protein
VFGSVYSQVVTGALDLPPLDVRRLSRIAFYGAAGEADGNATASLAYTLRPVGWSQPGELRVAAGDCDISPERVACDAHSLTVYGPYLAIRPFTTQPKIVTLKLYGIRQAARGATDVRGLRASVPEPRCGE